ERLVVARVDDRGAVGLDAVAERHRGVVEVLGNDPRAADRVRALAQVGVAERGGELAQLHREVRELHLAGERVVERAAAPSGPYTAIVVRGSDGGAEDGKAREWSQCVW